MQSDPRPNARVFRISCLIAAAIAALLVCALCFLRIDQAVAQYINRSGRPEWASAAQIVMVLSACGLFILAFGLVLRHLASGEQEVSKNELILGFASVILALACVELLRFVFGRIGPEEYLATGAYGFQYLSLGVEPSRSFPSEYGVLAGAIAGLVWPMAPTYRPTIFVLALLLPGSQILVGTHFVSDIVAGLAIGALAPSLMRDVLPASPAASNSR
jgi:membrane-associated phospholipid phosphatase